MNADANLVDARTGAIIMAHPKLSAIVPADQGCWEQPSKQR
jgi:hypothetical protein